MKANHKFAGGFFRLHSVHFNNQTNEHAVPDIAAMLGCNIGDGIFLFMNVLRNFAVKVSRSHE